MVIFKKPNCSLQLRNRTLQLRRKISYRLLANTFEFTWAHVSFTKYSLSKGVVVCVGYHGL